MSRLTDLLRQVRQSDTQLARDLEAEISDLTNRRTFGLVFEPHQPEAVELPGRPIRRGDKVRILPPRQETKPGDTRLWRVRRIQRTKEEHIAHLVTPGTDNPQDATARIDDLIVVAEFNDRIYPGLVETGRVERSQTKPFHTVINAENFHALEMLTYTHRHSIDAIYIDPPYNSGAKDWKYNNDYVEEDDDYRHSKWLAFMERRLEIARELLKPEDSVLIVTIDEKEYLRLGMLLEQKFREATIQMVTTVIAPQGSARGRFFKRSDEYIFFVFFGSAAVTPLPLGPEWGGATTNTVRGSIHWASLKRTGTGAQRTDREGMFYPIFIDEKAERFIAVGEPPGPGLPRESVEVPDGCIAVWPLRRDRTEGRWQVGPETLRSLIESGYVRIGRPNGVDTAISYLKAGEQRKVGIDYEVIGHRPDGSIITSDESAKEASFRPTTVWSLSRHSAGHHGSNLLRSMLPGRKFPFPKALYAVEDTLRFFVKEKPDAKILDFFAGSGTTAHAVMRLNKQDGGRRQSISVTNNEVSADEQRKLRTEGLRPGDPEWEQLGICDYVTKPRLTAAITGVTPKGDPIKGDYKFTDEFPMADGFEENAAFFTLTYETPLTIRHNRAFERIAPMLWLRAGAQGRVITDLNPEGWDMTEAYAILENFDQTDEFLECVQQVKDSLMVYVITDDESAFQMVCRALPEHHKPVRLYESYLQNFQINFGRTS